MSFSLLERTIKRASRLFTRHARISYARPIAQCSCHGRRELSVRRRRVMSDKIRTYVKSQTAAMWCAWRTRHDSSGPIFSSTLQSGHCRGVAERVRVRVGPSAWLDSALAGSRPRLTVLTDAARRLV